MIQDKWPRNTIYIHVRIWNNWTVTTPTKSRFDYTVLLCVWKEIPKTGKVGFKYR